MTQHTVVKQTPQYYFALRAENVRELLKRRQWTITQAARTAGINRAYLSSLLQHADDQPVTSTIAGKLAKAFGVHPDAVSCWQIGTPQ